MPSNHLILCCPLLLLPSIFPRIGLFSNESVLPIRWPKYWSFSFSISLSSEYSGLISFRVDWLGLAASVLQCSAFFMAQLSRMLIVQLKLGRSQSTLSLAGRVGSDCSWVQGIMPTSLSCGLQACGHRNVSSGCFSLGGFPRAVGQSMQLPRSPVAQTEG